MVKYGTAPPEFIKTVSTWVDKINASRKLIGIFELNPKLYPDGDTRKFVGKSKTALLNSMDESNQIVLLQKDSSLFRYIKNPSERVQIAAVSKYGSAIKYIIRAGITPSEAVQIAAVSKYGSAINYIIRAGITPSEAVQTASVSEDAYAIKYIIDAGITPSETVQLAAVSRSGLVIHYIIDAGITPSEAVQIAAVRHPHAMKIIIGAGITPSAAVRWAR